MRTGTLMIRKVVEYFVVNILLRVAAYLKIYTHSAEWLEVKVEPGAGVKGSRWDSDSRLSRSKEAALCID